MRRMLPQCLLIVHLGGSDDARRLLLPAGITIPASLLLRSDEVIE
jgi:hypothetical protein